MVQRLFWAHSDCVSRMAYFVSNSYPCSLRICCLYMTLYYPKNGIVSMFKSALVIIYTLPVTLLNFTWSPIQFMTWWISLLIWRVCYTTRSLRSQDLNNMGLPSLFLTLVLGIVIIIITMYGFSKVTSCTNCTVLICIGMYINILKLSAWLCEYQNHVKVILHDRSSWHVG